VKGSFIEEAAIDFSGVYHTAKNRVNHGYRPLGPSRDGTGAGRLKMRVETPREV
jgi:hypothetical protein